MEIVLPPHITESNIEQVEKAIKKLELENVTQTVNIDLSSVESVDFFGFQYLYFFKEYLIARSNSKDEVVIISGKTPLWSEYEAEIGLVL